MNKMTLAFVLCTGLIPIAQHSSAESTGISSGQATCYRNSQNLSPGTAAPGEYKVIHGPYTTQCGTTAHKFQLRAQSGARLPVTVEKMVAGGWTRVIRNESDPNQMLGNGTFRVILDNTEATLSTSYRGSFSIPL